LSQSNFNVSGTKPKLLECEATEDFVFYVQKTFENISLQLTILDQVKMNSEEPLIQQIIAAMMQTLSFYTETDFLRIYKKIRDPQAKLLILAVFCTVQATRKQ